VFALNNFVVPFQATAGGDAALRSQLGTELSAPEAWVVGQQWPAFVLVAIVVALLVRHPRLRTRATLTAALPAVAFLAAGALLVRRFLELGAPLALLALALVASEAARSGVTSPSRGTRALLAALTVAAGLGTVVALGSYGYGTGSPPLAMAQWLGQHGAPRERVFTAQWADSAPLFYYAPRVQSLVALDPTFFYAADGDRFERYVDVVEGRDAAPVRTIRQTFGARWVTLWRVPIFERLAQQLWRVPGIRVAYSDDDYVILDLAGAGGGRTPAPLPGG
jgi:hypothetical protein